MKNTEQEYDKLIFTQDENGVRNQPSDLCFLVGIPMYMYRVETYDFRSGLDFFEKAILKFKYMPVFPDADIAKLLNIDEKLVNLVEYELYQKKLISNTGTLTPEGKALRDDSEGLIIDDSKRKIGYIFQMIDGKTLYPYYVENINEIRGKNVGKVWDITIKEDEKPKQAFEISVKRESTSKVARPKQTDALNIILSTSRIGNISYDDNMAKNLAINFLPDDSPIPVMVFTYLYLPQSENDGLYKDDWQIQDPFGEEANVGLKFYIEDQHDEDLRDMISTCFNNAETDGKVQWADVDKQLKQEVEDKIAADFDEGFSNLPSNLKNYIESVVKYYISLQRHNFSDSDYEQSYAINIQKIFEFILLNDQQRRIQDYVSVDFKYYGDKKNPTYEDRRKYDINSLYNRFTRLRYAPNELSVLARYSTIQKSLKSYLLKYIYSCGTNPNNSLRPLLMKSSTINTILEIANLRNENAHGTTEIEQDSLSREDIDRLYNFTNKFINDYINL